MTEAVPYDQLDAGIVKLVKVLNSFDGITTNESCEGHNQDTKWSVMFDVQHDEAGWVALEFITWCVDDYSRSGHLVSIGLHAFPPYLNAPGKTLYFFVMGKREEENPDDLADWLGQTKEELFVTPEEAEDLAYVCDQCGYQSDSLSHVAAHLAAEHSITDGVLTLRHSDETTTVVDLAKWLKDMLAGDK